LEKHSIEEYFGKTKVVWLVIRIKIVQRNNYGTSYRTSPNGSGKREMDDIGSNSICQPRQLSQIPHISCESIIRNIDRNDIDPNGVQAKCPSIIRLLPLAQSEGDLSYLASASCTTC
jgi:hypothetical protein